MKSYRTTTSTTKKCFSISTVSQNRLQRQTATCNCRWPPAMCAWVNSMRKTRRLRLRAGTISANHAGLFRWNPISMKKLYSSSASKKGASSSYPTHSWWACWMKKRRISTLSTWVCITWKTATLQCGVQLQAAIFALKTSTTPNNTSRASVDTNFASNARRWRTSLQIVMLCKYFFFLFTQAQPAICCFSSAHH